MVMMGCFALFRLDEHALVLLPGNLAVGGGLFVGAVAVALRRSFSLVVGLLSAGLTALMGILAVTSGASVARFLRLPGYPFIWVVIGLYIAFRLVLNHQHEQRLRRTEDRERANQPPSEG
jgi:hypothetical protein